MNIITGEKIQQLCDVYFGLKEDFDFNPVIKKQIMIFKNLVVIQKMR